jgi:hypothetical protein
LAAEAFRLAKGAKKELVVPHLKEFCDALVGLEFPSQKLNREGDDVQFKLFEILARQGLMSEENVSSELMAKYMTTLCRSDSQAGQFTRLLG